MFAVPIGTFPIEARAPGCGVWRGSVEVSAQVTAQVPVVLQRAASVHGTITTADGKPAGRLSVHVGRDYDVMSSTTRTGMDGHFVLPDVGPGEIALEADGEELGKVSGIVVAAPGEDVEWNATLSTGLHITGRVLDEADLPVASVQVTAFPTRREDGDEGHYFASAVTDRDGRFMLQNLKAVSHYVEVRISGDRLDLKQDVRPGTAELVFRISRDHLATASIAGRIVDAAGDPIEGARISPQREGSVTGLIVTADLAGRFTIGRLPAGRYRIRVDADQRPAVLAPRHDLAAGETWEAGDIVVPDAGSLEVRVRRAEGAAATDPGLCLVALDDSAPREPLTITGDIARALKVAPGRYVVAVTGDDHAHTRHAVEVRAGETSTVEVVIEPGFEKVLRIRRAVPRAPDLVTVTVLDLARQCVSEQHVIVHGLTYDLVLCQLPGRYTVEASSATQSGSAFVEIGGTSPRDEVVELMLR
ncbi:MAG: carboxypeptidase-like regulatory domain-containing protein [Planctomycetota bacterium]